MNGHDIEAGQEEVVTTMFAAAAGQRTEADLADWVRRHLAKLA
jgi:prophage maintenance system killer protein